MAARAMAVNCIFAVVLCFVIAWIFCVEEEEKKRRSVTEFCG
jgi:hypothetical protein